MKKIKGKLTISRVHSTQSEDWIEVLLEDESSCIQFADVHIGLEEFSKAITGLGACPCEIEVRGLDLVGKKLETKICTVSFPTERTVEMTEDVFKMFEFDGWEARRSDMNNSHNRMWIDTVDLEKFRITFQRYV